MATPSKKLILPPALGSFVFIWEARPPMDGKGEPKYSIALLWPKKTDLKELKQAINDVATQAFGKDAPNLLAKGKLWNPLRDGDEDKADYADFKGMVYVNAKSTQKPGIVDKNVKPIIDREEAYSGCIYRASVSLFAYDKGGQKGVAVGLQNLQVVKGKAEGMPRLDNRKTAEEEFEAFASENDDLV